MTRLYPTHCGRPSDDLLLSDRGRPLLSADDTEMAMRVSTNDASYFACVNTLFSV